MDIPQEELEGLPPADLDWPYQGLVEFQNVTLRYGLTLPPALHNITFTIAGGMQVSGSLSTYKICASTRFVYFAEEVELFMKMFT